MDRLTQVLRLVVLSFALAAASMPACADAAEPAQVANGQYVWHPEIAPAGPLVVVVSLDEQRVYVYRNGVAIGVSSISSGRKGYETPPGVYTILQKDRDHHSNLYDNAPMPFMERLTWDGLAMHGGHLPGRPASHGCVRLPHAFAEKLFAVTERGQTVVVANSKVAPASIVHPAVLAPVGTTGQTLPATGPEARYTWNNAAPAEGPVSVLVTLGDRSVHVLRDGERIGEAALDVADGFEIGGTLLFVVEPGFESMPSRLDASRPRHRLTVYPIAGAEATGSLDTLAANLHVADAFARALYPLLVPGTTVLITDLPAVREESRAPLMPVLESETGDDPAR